MNAGQKQWIDIVSKRLKLGQINMYQAEEALAESGKFTDSQLKKAIKILNK